MHSCEQEDGLIPKLIEKMEIQIGRILWITPSGI